MPIRRRERFTRHQIEEIKTTGKLVLCIISAAIFVVGCYLWLAGAVPGSVDKPAPSGPDAVPELNGQKQPDGDAAVLARARAQQSCDEGNQDACTLLRQPDLLDMVSDPPVGTREQPGK